MNSIRINGILVKDPVLKSFDQSSDLCTFIIVNEEWNGNKKKTGYYKCKAWGVMAKLISGHCRIGTEIIIEGSLDQYRYKKDSGEMIYDISIEVKHFETKERAKEAS